LQAVNKNVRILKWLLILLVVLNIGTIGTIIYLTQKQNKLSDESILIKHTINLYTGAEKNN